jgi:hypothetical protein
VAEALAMLSVREGLRLKTLWTVSLLAILAGALAWWSDADGTHAGRAKLVLEACLTGAGVLGAALIVLLSALSVSREIEQRIMYTLGTKPVPRWVLLAGKALGFWAVELLFIAGVVLWAMVLVRLVPLRPELRKESQVVVSGTWNDLRRNALVTREYVEAEGAERRLAMPRIKPGGSYSWTFSFDPAASGGEAVTVSILLSSTQTFEKHIRDVRVSAGYVGETPLYERTSVLPKDRPFEIHLDPVAAGKPGMLAVTLTAADASRGAPTLVAPASGAVRLGFVRDGFLSNLLKMFFSHAWT